MSTRQPHDPQPGIPVSPLMYTSASGVCRTILRRFGSQLPAKGLSVVRAMGQSPNGECAVSRTGVDAETVLVEGDDAAPLSKTRRAVAAFAEAAFVDVGFRIVATVPPGGDRS